jgi:hypothetical protein
MNGFEDKFAAFAWRPINTLQLAREPTRPIGEFNGVTKIDLKSRGKILITVCENDGQYIDQYPLMAWRDIVFSDKYKKIQAGGAYQKYFTSGSVLQFVRYVWYCLDLLNTFQDGRELLTKIQETSTKKGKMVVITPSLVGSNQYLANKHGEPSLAIAKTVIGGEAMARSGKLTPQLGTIVRKLSKISTYEPNKQLAWLHNKVVEQPIWTNHGRALVNPYAPPGNTEGDRECDLVWQCGPRELSQGDFIKWLASPKPQSLQNHITTHNKTGNPSDLEKHLKSAVIRALYEESPPGTGAHALVHFTPGLADDRDKNKMNKDRPHVLALAHELIHALRVLAGEQPDRSDTEIVLTEMACVGLGPWESDNKFPTENRLRQNWFSTLQQQQAAKALASRDPVNQRKHSILRPYYAWDEETHLGQRGTLSYSGSLTKGVTCSLCKKQHGDSVSSFFGRWHCCEKCGKHYCDSCGKSKLASWSMLSRERKCKCGGKTVLIE